MMTIPNSRIRTISMLLFLLLATSCSPSKVTPIEIPDRESVIPAEKEKMQPESDTAPPLAVTAEYAHPVPLPYPVNTKGAEDSPFILPDGNTLYVWFTPDNNADLMAQAQDMATGIYRFEKTEGGWSSAERMWFAEPGETHLDGCGFFQGNTAWICGVREGFDGMHWLRSEYSQSTWSAVEPVDFIAGFEVGELHISGDGSELYFHSAQPGGLGGLDIWVSEKVDGMWQVPMNLGVVNSESDEGWPALSPDETELWFNRDYGLWRSKKVNGEWQMPELMISPLAGEATLDIFGNVYFTHHYFVDGKMAEADIYVAQKK